MYFLQSDLLEGMSRDFVKGFMAISEKISREPGEFLFHEGDPADSFWILLKGRVKLSIGTTAHFTTPREDRHLEDYVEGDIHEFGPISVTENDIIEFGKKFDPQVFHTDPIKAKEMVYGGLIASGWHTSSLFMRLFVDNYLAGKASLGSPGVDELRWLKPVRPGDSLLLRVTVHKVKPSTTKPDRGVLFSFCEMVNQEDDVVSTMMALNLIRYRDRP